MTWQVSISGTVAVLASGDRAITMPATAVSWAGGICAVHIPADLVAELDATQLHVVAEYPNPEIGQVAELVDQLPAGLVGALLAEESGLYGMDAPMGLIAITAVRRAILGELPRPEL